jgi:hypothetical protein
MSLPYKIHKFLENTGLYITAFNHFPIPQVSQMVSEVTQCNAPDLQLEVHTMNPNFELAILMI